MVKDVVPELVKSIEKAFQIHTESDRILARVSKRIRDGTATQEDGHMFAVRLGKSASKALQDVLTKDNLPDGKLYYNIATRTVIPTLENNQNLINNAASAIQKIEDSKRKLSLNAVRPSFPKERVADLIDKMTADDIELDQALIWIKEPIVNNSEAFFDDFIRQNARFRSDAGLKTTITRIAEPKCCEWCRALEGTYKYGDHPGEIFARHEFCRCTVTYRSERTSQNVWSKKSWESTDEEIERRVGTKPQIKSKYERDEMLARLERDKEINRIMELTGYTRRTSEEIARQTPEKIAQDIERAQRNKQRRR